MILEKLRVENFKCIEDSTDFALDQVTCLMGKNEAGKTALLEALYKLNPVEEDEADFTELEYPRRFLTTTRERDDLEDINVLTTTWALSSSEYNLLLDIFGEDTIPDQRITIKKGYGNYLNWNINLDEEKFISHLMNSYKLDASERAQLQKCSTISSIINKIVSIESPTDKHKSLLSYLQQNFLDGSLSEKLEDTLGDNLPHFVYFDVYHKLPGKVALTDLKQRLVDNNLRFGDKIFLALLDMTSSDLDEVESIGESEKLVMELESIENSLTDQIFEYWSQNRHLEVNFRFDQARPQDEPPYNHGYIFNTRIYNRRHRASVNFDDRSTGFIWFFSFLVWFSQVKRNYGQNLLLLLDEPGLSLHGKAQKDLIRYINEKLYPDYQVIYTAHSPFMIDVDHIFSIRTVEDVVEITKENDQQIEHVLGTKVGDRILSKDKDTLFPLQGILGYDIAQTLFVGPYVVVVEGPTEFLLFHWFSRQLIKRDREGLDIRWAVCPAESANKVTSFVTLFRGRGLKIATLLDYHEGQKGIVDRLEQSNLLEPDHLLKTTSYVDQEDADIEDLLGRDFYIDLVNNSLNLPPQSTLPKIKPKDSNIRIVKEVEDYCKLLPLGYPNFDHYIPIQYLLGLSDNEIETLPDLNNALDRFEKLFKDLNSLI